MQNIYLIISNNGSRTKVAAAVASLEVAKQYFTFLDNNHPDSYIRENVDAASIKYYNIENDSEKVFKEHMYIVKHPVITEPLL